MKVALIDGDMLCYRVGFACENEDAGIAASTMDRFLIDLVSKLPATEWEVFLTGKTNFRYQHAVTVPYKGNRAELKKPQHLQTLRDFLVDKWSAQVSDNQEADDSISIRATELGDDAIIVSLDKDFDQCTGWHYNFVKDLLYYIQPEEGMLNFYMQFLTGDRIDNIIGVKGIGPVKARKLLEDCATAEEMFNVCVEKLGYERAVENGTLLHLRRQPDEIWQPPCTNQNEE